MSGKMFETLEKTLSRFPDTLLGDPDRRGEYEENGVICFDRSRNAFESILLFYQSNGRFVWKPRFMDNDIFIEEMIFFGLDRYRKKRSVKAGFILTNFRFIGSKIQNLYLSKSKFMLNLSRWILTGKKLCINYRCGTLFKFSFAAEMKSEFVIIPEISYKVALFLKNDDFNILARFFGYISSIVGNGCFSDSFEKIRLLNKITL